MLLFGKYGILVPANEPIAFISTSERLHKITIFEAISRSTFFFFFFFFTKIKSKFFILAATDLQWKYGVQRVLSIGTKVSFLSIKIDKGQKACSCNWLEGEEAAVEFLRPKLKATMCILWSGLKWRRCHRILGRSWNGPRIKAKNCFYFSRKNEGFSFKITREGPAKSEAVMRTLGSLSSLPGLGDPDEHWKALKVLRR